MKTFGLYMLLFLFITIGLSLGLSDWTSQQVITQSTIFAYIMQQYFTKETEE